MQIDHITSEQFLHCFISNQISNVQFSIIQGNLRSYYKPFQPQFSSLFGSSIEQQWDFELLKINEQILHIKTFYSTMRTQQSPLFAWTQQSRLLIEAQLLLKTLNMKIPNYYKFKLSKEGCIFLQTVIKKVFYYPIFKTLPNIIRQMESIVNKFLHLVVPFLKVSVKNFNQACKLTFGKLNSSDKIQQNQDKRELSPAEKMTSLKILFEQLRRQRHKATKLLLSTNYLNINKKQTIKQIFSLYFGHLQHFMEQYLVNHQFKQQIHQQLKKSTKIQQPKVKHTNHKFIHSIIQISKILKKCQNNQEQGSHSLINISQYQFKHLITSISDLDQKTKKRLQFRDSIQIGFLACKLPKKKIQSINSFKNQIAVLHAIRHHTCPFICKYYKDQSKQGLFSVAYKQDFLKLIQKDYMKQKRLTTEKKIILMSQIIEGICFLSQKKICHRDLKMKNIMIDKNYNARIIDFGSSCTFYGQNHIHISQKRVLSTPDYYFDYKDCQKSIKQLYNSCQYEQHPNFDSYSIGRIIEKIFFKLTSGNPQIHLSSELYNMMIYVIGRCLDQNPSDRLSAKQISIIFSQFIGIQNKLQLQFGKIDEVNMTLQRSINTL